MLALAAGWELFTRQDYFDAHELWEHHWRALSVGQDKLLIQALIQWAVALHHHQRHNPEGATRLLDKALRVMSGYEALEIRRLRGFDLGGILQAMRRQAAQLAMQQPMTLPDAATLDPLHVRP